MDYQPDQPSGADQPWGGAPPSTGPVIAATGTGRSRARPGRAWYLAPLAVFIGGAAWVVFGLVSIGNQLTSSRRWPLHAGGAVTLDHSGGYVVYYEGPGARSGHIPAFNVRIVSAAPPSAVGSLRPDTASVIYTFGGHRGRAVLTLQVLHPGRFLVEPSGAAAVAGGSDLAFGPIIGRGTVSAVLLGLGLIVLGIIGAVVLFIIRLTQVRRGHARGW